MRTQRKKKGKGITYITNDFLKNSISVSLWRNIRNILTTKTFDIDFPESLHLFGKCIFLKIVDDADVEKTRTFDYTSRICLFGKIKAAIW